MAPRSKSQLLPNGIKSGRPKGKKPASSRKRLTKDEIDLIRDHIVPLGFLPVFIYFSHDVIREESGGDISLEFKTEIVGYPNIGVFLIAYTEEGREGDFSDNASSLMHEKKPIYHGVMYEGGNHPFFQDDYGRVYTSHPRDFLPKLSIPDAYDLMSDLLPGRLSPRIEIFVSTKQNGDFRGLLERRTPGVEINTDIHADYKSLHTASVTLSPGITTDTIIVCLLKHFEDVRYADREKDAPGASAPSPPPSVLDKIPEESEDDEIASAPRPSPKKKIVVIQQESLKSDDSSEEEETNLGETNSSEDETDEEEAEEPSSSDESSE